MRISLLLLALLPGLAAAATPTDTSTASPTPSSTPTATPGEGSALASPSVFTIGSSGNTLELVYTAGATAWPASSGILAVFFPLGLTLPNGFNFYPLPSDAAKVPFMTYNGLTVLAHVKNLAPGANLTFRYGYDPSGFTVGTTQAAGSILISAYPQSVTLGTGGLIALPPSLVFHSPTPTPTVTLTRTITETSTVSQTFSITPTFSVTPTMTISATFSITPTETPLGEIKAGELYTYPNPFDLAKFDKVTLRFPPDAEAKVSIFNLVGEPVCELPAPDINGAAGWAIWRGRDDRNRPAPGGIYFARVKGSKVFIKRFTVVN